MHQRPVPTYRKNQKVFSQGDPADSVFYIQEGKVKVCVVSEQGKEAVVALHGSGDFFGERCLSGQPLRLATVSAITDSVVMRLDKASIGRVLRDEPKLSEMFMSFLLARNARVAPPTALVCLLWYTKMRCLAIGMGDGLAPSNRCRPRRGPSGEDRLQIGCEFVAFA